MYRSSLIKVSSNKLIVRRMFSTLEIGKKYEGGTYDYINRGYSGLIDFMRDPSVKRLGENSLIITVEGNMGSGKSAFARELAKRCEYVYAREIDLDYMLYTQANGLNRRLELNKITAGNEKYRLNTLDEWHANPMYKRTAQLQMKMYYCRYFQYLMALQHLFSTGQGVVIERSPHADCVYTEALYETNLLSKEAYTWYRTQYYEQSITNLWKPNLMIYMQRTPHECMQTLVNERGLRESKALSEELLTNIDRIYTKKFLPEYAKMNHVLYCDAARGIEEVLINMEQIDFNDESKAKDWRVRRVTNVNVYRALLADYKFHKYLFERMKGYVRVPELLCWGEEAHVLEDLLRDNALTDPSDNDMFALFKGDKERQQLKKFLF